MKYPDYTPPAKTISVKDIYGKEPAIPENWEATGKHILSDIHGQ